MMVAIYKNPRNISHNDVCLKKERQCDASLCVHFSVAFHMLYLLLQRYNTCIAM